jgi:hypothetical protein
MLWFFVFAGIGGSFWRGGLPASVEPALPALSANAPAVISASGVVIRFVDGLPTRRMLAVALELRDLCRLYAMLAAVFAVRALFGDETLAGWVCAFVGVGHVTILHLGRSSGGVICPELSF